MFRYIILILFSLIEGVLFAQKIPNYDWQTSRKQFKLSDLEHKEQVIILKDKRTFEFFSKDGEQIDCYKLYHKIIKVNSEAAIERFNKVFIPISGNSKIIQLKVRVILMNGKEILLNKENIKEIDNLENAGAYRIFAVEGVEKGAEIEYFYSVKTPNHEYGREYLQSEFNTKNLDFTIYSYPNIIVTPKVYNYKESFTFIDSAAFNAPSKHHFSVNQLTALNEEEFSSYRANLTRVDYVVNTPKTKEQHSWDVNANLIKLTYNEFSEKELKAVKKLIKAIKIPKNETDELVKITKIENYLKTNFTIDDNSNTQSITEIIEQKNGQDWGISRLFFACLKVASVNYELVLTNDRTLAKFDSKFEFPLALQEFLIYFPNLNSYLSPSEPEYRYPLVPYQFTHNYGLFINSHESKVKFIEPSNATQSQHNHYIQCKIDFVNELVLGHIKNVMSGHKAMYVKPYLQVITEEQKKEILEGIVKSSAPDAKIKSVNVINSDLNLSVVTNPLIIESDFESTSLIERAGEKYLFKIGELIGDQMEMYQPNKRQQEIEADFNRIYIREIDLEIPNGYRVKNLNDINLKQQLGADFIFTSTYKIEGNKLKIKVEEYYKTINCSVANFEQYRKVINAAADFNKVTLVLESIR
ncbi:MAG: hypothetical protein RLZZ175_1115 [Bacteroidota bacterium]|jgi:hypothetical protein